MSVPLFTIDGILPPFTGVGPGDDPALRSPYMADSIEVVARFGSSAGRRQILKGWLDQRSMLRGIGIVRGFQWLDGSFLEEKDPKDLDVVCFFHFPDTVRTEEEQRLLWNSHAQLFERKVVKQKFSLDAFFLPPESSPRRWSPYLDTTCSSFRTSESLTYGRE
jgi:hypothetical protein